VLQANVAGCREHLVRLVSAIRQLHVSDGALLEQIEVIDALTRGTYGWPRTWKELLAWDIGLGKQRLRKLMQLHGLRAKGKRRVRVTTDRNHDLPTAPTLR
jgi:putative transposase